MENNKIYLLSYPKSGRTWLRLIIGKYFSLKYKEDEESSLSLGQQLEKYGLKNLIHTHASYTWVVKQELTLDQLTDAPIILLKRNIKDTLVSYYHHFAYRNRKDRYEGSISDFLRSPQGVSQIKEFYNKTSKMNFIFVTSYEDLHSNAFEVTKTVLHLLGENVDTHLLHGAVEFCKFDNMQKYEKEQKLGISTNVQINPNNVESFKVRQGKVNNFDNYLSKEDIQYIDREMLK